MNHQALITQFYEAFKNKDASIMAACYHSDAQFSDAVFKNLNSKEVGAMWKMLIERGKDLRLEYRSVLATENTAKAHWEATYTFGLTKRKVVNNIEAHFTFKDGLILTHTDTFDFYKWSKQAFGWKGWLLGWTAFFNQKVSDQAMKGLQKFMEVNP